MQKEKELELTPEDARLIIYDEHNDWKMINDEIYDTGRWSEFHESVYLYISSNKFYKFNWSVGLTEMQDERPYEYDNIVKPIEVVPKDIIKTIYVKKEV